YGLAARRRLKDPKLAEHALRDLIALPIGHLEGLDLDRVHAPIALPPFAGSRCDAVRGGDPPFRTRRLDRPQFGELLEPIRPDDAHVPEPEGVAPDAAGSVVGDDDRDVARSRPGHVRGPDQACPGEAGANPLHRSWRRRLAARPGHPEGPQGSARQDRSGPGANPVRPQRNRAGAFRSLLPPPTRGRYLIPADPIRSAPRLISTDQAHRERLAIRPTDGQVAVAQAGRVDLVGAPVRHLNRVRGRLWVGHVPGVQLRRRGQGPALGIVALEVKDVL